MTIWRRISRAVNDILLSQEFRRIDDNGERVAEFLVPTGGLVRWHANVDVPEGWLKCDGKLYAVTEYRELYNVIGNIYGGLRTSSTFAVPTVSNEIIKA